MTMLRGLRMSLIVAFGVVVLACGDRTTPTSPTTSTGPTTETFTSQLTPRGGATRAFAASVTGSVTVTLTSLSGDIPIGMGVGIPFANGSNCYLSASVETGPSSSPQIEVPVDAGQYCVKVYDAGTLAGPVTFSLTVVHP
jgi:hypothetical protein